MKGLTVGSEYFGLLPTFLLVAYHLPHLFLCFEMLHDWDFLNGLQLLFVVSESAEGKVKRCFFGTYLSS